MGSTGPLSGGKFGDDVMTRHRLALHAGYRSAVKMDHNQRRSDGVLDECLKEDPQSKDVCEIAIGNKMVMVVDAITEMCLKDGPQSKAVCEIATDDKMVMVADAITSVKRCLKDDPKCKRMCKTATDDKRVMVVDAITSIEMCLKCLKTDQHSKVVCFLCTTVVFFCGLAHMMLLNMISVLPMMCCDYMTMVAACKIYNQVFDGVLMCLKDDPKSKVVCVADAITNMCLKDDQHQQSKDVCEIATYDKMVMVADAITEMCLKDDQQSKAVCEITGDNMVMVADAVTSIKKCLKADHQLCTTVVQLAKDIHGCCCVVCSCGLVAVCFSVLQMMCKVAVDNMNDERCCDGVLMCLKDAPKSKVACVTATMMDMIAKAVRMMNKVGPDKNTCGWMSGQHNASCAATLDKICHQESDGVLEYLKDDSQSKVVWETAISAENMCCRSFIWFSGLTHCKICHQVLDGVLMCLKDDPKSKVACVSATMVMDRIAKAVRMMNKVGPDKNTCGWMSGQHNVSCAATLDKIDHAESDGFLEPVKDDSQSKVVCEAAIIHTTFGSGNVSTSTRFASSV